MLFDSHAHLNDLQYANDIGQVLERAKDAGIEAIVDIGWDRHTIERSKQISETYSWVYSAFGFHPHEAKQVTREDLKWLREQLQYPRCMAFGEIGLDTVKNYSSIEIQKKILEQQLELAKEIEKPVIFHSRGGEKQVLDRAISVGIKKAVFHCYTGDKSTAEKILEQGYYISFAGFVTFPKGLPDWLDRVPLNRLLIETDCPYLAPVPNRGKRNEPCNIVYTCRKIAEALKMSEEEVANITTANAREFYGIGYGKHE